MGEIDIRGFSGANNISQRFYSGQGIAEPQVILNADVDIKGTLTARAGRTLYVSLPNAHSLWGGVNCSLCVADGTLYRIADGKKTSIATVTGPRYPVSYLEAEDKVFISNPYWQGVFDPVTNLVAAWGITLPPGPMLLAGDGSLPAGTYHVCLTNTTDGEISGNGPIATITLTETGGIQILNRPAGALAWATDANEPIFYLVGALSQIVDIPSFEPLPSFLCSPPPFLENLCYAFGRIWGSSENEVYYSQPFKLGWFKLASNHYSFEDTVTLIARVPTGLYVGMKGTTRFLAGTIPEQMQQSGSGAGSIKGTLAYCNNMPELSTILGTAERDYPEVPVWLTTEGVVVGGPSGKLFNISKNKLKMSIPTHGASLYRNREGFIQFLTSFKQGTTNSGRGFSDAETDAAFLSGKIDTHNNIPTGIGTRAGFSDSATCEVRRGGILI